MPSHSGVQVKVLPPLQRVEEILSRSVGSAKAPTIVPLCASIPAYLKTPSPAVAYMKIATKSGSKNSFLLESAQTNMQISRYSFVGAGPRKILKTGAGHGPEVDPMPRLDEELAKYREARIPELEMPPLAGGAIGYVGYDCVRYFEPKTARPMKDFLGIPESLFMIFDTIIAFDNHSQRIKVFSYLHIPEKPEELSAAYDAVVETIKENVQTLLSEEIPIPEQDKVKLDHPFVSNIGRKGYEAHVTALKKHICVGDIIQAVPSQRIARPTSLHPFNIYQHLRTINPSPYHFYLFCEDFSVVGASPELLVKTDSPDNRRIITHPIAGTIRRDPNPAEDNRLSRELHDSIKDRAEHVMLVDLARNDVNRVCDPLTTRVDRLMEVEKFSHVQHMTSQVSGRLRAGKSRFDAFRSIFPAGTVSGAPKVRAMELIAELEGERRGTYAGAVGYFGYSKVSFEPAPADGEASGDAAEAAADAVLAADGKRYAPVETPGEMDTCIALRTMMVREKVPARIATADAEGGGETESQSDVRVAYLQAGGGIVFDSDPYEEYIETENKLAANVNTIKQAEQIHAEMNGVDERPWRVVELLYGAEAK